MIFKELKKMPYAKGQLKKMAKGRHHCVEYEVGEYSSKKTEEKCSVYIANYDYCHATTWHDALQVMKRQIEKRGEQ